MVPVLRHLGRRFAIPVAAGGLLLIAAGVTAGQGAVEAGMEAEFVRASRSDVGDRGALADVYAARSHRPIWIEDGVLGAGGRRAVEILRRAEDHGLAGDSYIPAGLSALIRDAEHGRLDPRSAGRLEAGLSLAFVRFARDLRTPAPSDEMIRVAGIGPRPEVDARGVLETVINTGGPAGVDAALRMHPEYDRLSAALAEWRRSFGRLPVPAIPPGRTVAPGQRDPRIPTLRVRLGAPQPGLDADVLDPALVDRLERFQAWHGLDATASLDRATVEALNLAPVEYERRLITNLSRLRALPGEPGGRHLVVNVAEATLTAYQDGAPVKRMRVIVGAPDNPTPMMAGLIQYVVVDPYWNVPMDLVRDRIAPGVLRDGPASFEARGLEALSDWSSSARPLKAADIDWAAVADGRSRVRVRQKPGPGNMMGRVKFMLPNDLGIYLHDTPDRALFEREGRALSAGCVRLEDARWLAQWLSNFDVAGRDQRVEQRMDLARPAPVFITYQTVTPRAGGGLAVLPDVYGRDRRSRLAFADEAA
ncbi:MAG: murein L,D-transpeptidase [Brevundimonas sp.]